MTAVWTVFSDVKAISDIKHWATRNRVELDAIQTLLREGGPDSLGWNAMDRVGHASWERLVEPYRAVFWTAFEQRFYRVTLEVLPGRTIIVRGAAHGVYRRGPKGR